MAMESMIKKDVHPCYPNKKYNRDDAIDYASQWYNSHNPDYMALDDPLFTAMYAEQYFTFTGMADCANFVSQCIYAGGVEQNEDWYYYSHKNELSLAGSILYGDTWKAPRFIDKDGNPTSNPIDYYFSAQWTSANAQYEYFSDKKNGYTATSVIEISSVDEIQAVIESGKIEKGDLLYWSNNNGETVHHATIISNVSENDILFAGHTRSAFDKSLFENLGDEMVIIVKLRDYLVQEKTHE